MFTFSYERPMQSCIVSVKTYVFKSDKRLKSRNWESKLELDSDSYHNHEEWQKKDKWLEQNWTRLISKAESKI